MECLVTKLKGTVSDNSILKLGELRIKISELSKFDPAKCSLILRFNKETELSIVGNGYFTDINGTANLGKTKKVVSNELTDIFVSNSGCEISIPNKSDLNYLSLDAAASYDSDTSDTMFENKVVHIEDLYYTNLNYINLGKSGSFGDITGLAKIKGLASLYLSNLDGERLIYGNVDDLLRKDTLRSLVIGYNNYLYSLNINGNIANANSNIVQLTLRNTNIHCDLSSLPENNNLYYLDLAHSAGLTGSISTITDSKFPSITYFGIAYTGVSGGELATLPKKVNFITGNGLQNASFSWKQSRPTDAFILALENINLGSDIDAMLINQANCQIGYTHNKEEWFKKIIATGTRTSASDAAIATLQEKGYTISVPVATDASSVSLISTMNFAIAYKDKGLIVGPVDLTKMQIYPASDVIVKKFDTKENAEKFIASAGLVRSESE